MQRNVAGQVVAVQIISASDGTAKPVISASKTRTSP